MESVCLCGASHRISFAPRSDRQNVWLVLVALSSNTRDINNLVNLDLKERKRQRRDRLELYLSSWDASFEGVIYAIVAWLDWSIPEDPLNAVENWGFCFEEFRGHDWCILPGLAFSRKHCACLKKTLLLWYKDFNVDVHGTSWSERLSRREENEQKSHAIRRELQLRKGWRQGSLCHPTYKASPEPSACKQEHKGVPWNETQLTIVLRWTERMDKSRQRDSDSWNAQPKPLCRWPEPHGEAEDSRGWGGGSPKSSLKNKRHKTRRARTYSTRFIPCCVHVCANVSVYMCAVRCHPQE